MAPLSGLRADYEIGRFGITPTHVEALKSLTTPPAAGSVAPSIYSGGGGPTRPSGPAQEPASVSTPPRQPLQSVGQKVASRWLMGGQQPPQQVETPSLVTGPSPAVRGNQPSGQVQATPAASAVQQPAATTVRGGIASTPNPSAPGRRDWAMGAPGSDGSMRGFSQPGKAGGGGIDIRQAAMQGLTGRATIPGAGGGYSFEGSAADAMKFGAPVAVPARVVMGQTAGGDYRSVRDSHESAKASLAAVPQYLGPESGLNWKTREKLYETQMDAYNKDKANKNMVGIEAMREAGAGRRAILAASGEGERSALERKRLGMAEPGMLAETALRQGELSLKQAELSSMNDMAAARKNLTGLTPGTPEYAAAERKLATLSGKFGEQKQPNVQMIEEPFDPSNPAAGNVKRPVRINDDGTYSRMAESGGDPMARITSDPARKKAFDALTPEKKTEFLTKLYQ